MFSRTMTVRQMLIQVAQWDDNHRREMLLELLAGLDDDSFREAIGELLVAAYEEDSPLLDLHTFGRMVQERYAERRSQECRRMSNHDLLQAYGEVRWFRQNLGEDQDSAEPKKRAGYVCACIQVDEVEDELHRRLEKWRFAKAPCNAISEPPPQPPEEKADADVQEPV